ncbi:PAS domain-containing protein (plasmid) [Ensifer adhaerens]|uniref:PAS domain-containing sensor histidine kinase n=1 Tax=Ensifer adhaerens TaxID=106592 RepID=UPI0023A9A7BD|nr:PAS domain-containing sensor histidine kinase [Ensifer adhaerens]WDZ79324.1 PAS domain-containing protein [Ensifer adhaerens]
MSNDDGLTKCAPFHENTRNTAALALDLLENIPGHVWSMDPAGRFIYRNRSMDAYFGVGLCDHGAWLERVHRDDQRYVAASWRESMEAGQPFDNAHRLRGVDGEFRWFRASGRPTRDPRGHVAGWHGQTIDIEHQKRAEESLRARSLELSLLVDMVPSNLWRLTPDGTTTLVNKRMADYLGLDLSNVSDVASVMDTIFHPDDADAVFAELTRCLATGERFSMRYRLLRADGMYRWMSGRAEPMRDQDGNIVQWFGLCHDIEDQVQTTAALRRSAEKLAQATQAANLSQLSASIAHEVNQPLAAIATDTDACLRWLSADPPNIERGKLAAERITQDIVAAAEVISRIRALFKHQPQARTVEDVNRLVHEVLDLMSDEIAATTTRIDMNLDPRLPKVSLDRVQVQQVLVNLIRNGIQAMDATNPLRSLKIMSNCERPGTIRISVEDVGSGFKDPERVFEPFFTTKSNGMGMGLPICRSIVEAHGGRLWVTNNDAFGATVAFTLPVA